MKPMHKITPLPRRPASRPGAGRPGGHAASAKGASYLSPGRSPGNPAAPGALALKGQPNATFQAAAGWPGAIPGLRPGLRNGRPFGPPVCACGPAGSGQTPAMWPASQHDSPPDAGRIRHGSPTAARKPELSHFLRT